MIVNPYQTKGAIKNVNIAEDIKNLYIYTYINLDTIYNYILYNNYNYLKGPYLSVKTPTMTITTDPVTIKYALNWYALSSAQPCIAALCR